MWVSPQGLDIMTLWWTSKGTAWAACCSVNRCFVEHVEENKSWGKHLHALWLCPCWVDNCIQKGKNSIVKYFDFTWEDLKNKLMWHLVGFHWTANQCLLQNTEKKNLKNNFRIEITLILSWLTFQYDMCCLRNINTADPGVCLSPLTLKLSGESRCSFFFMSSDAPAHSL